MQEKSKRPTFKQETQLTEKTYEVQETITKINEVYPIHIGNTILHLSKLLLLEFVTFLEKFLQKESFKLCYTGNLKFPLNICKSFDRHGLAVHRAHRRNGQVRQAGAR